MLVPSASRTRPYADFIHYSILLAHNLKVSSRTWLALQGQRGGTNYGREVLAASLRRGSRNCGDVKDAAAKRDMFVIATAYARLAKFAGRRGFSETDGSVSSKDDPTAKFK
jgi:hypothetical protein